MLSVPPFCLHGLPCGLFIQIQLFPQDFSLYFANLAFGTHPVGGANSGQLKDRHGGGFLIE